MTDLEIIERILAGNRNDFRLLVEKYKQLVFSTCMGFVHHEEDANEITQDVFVSAYQSLSSFRQKSAFSTWLYRIATNASLNFLRQKKRPVFRMDLLFGGEKQGEVQLPDVDVENPEQLMISREQREIIQKKLDELPDKQKTALVLSKYDNLSQKEIAAVMEISEGAVEQLIQRGKANLHKKLGAVFKK